MIINTNIALLPALADSFSALKLADANVSGETFTINGSMINVAKASGDLTPVLGTGKSEVAASGVSRFAPSLDVPVAKEQGLAVQDGSTGYFVFADAAVNVYGFDEKSGIWLQIGNPAAKSGFNISMNTDYTHAQHGSINISRVFVQDPASTATARSQFRMVPQKGVSGAALAVSETKSQFSQEVEMDSGLTVAGTATLGSWTMEDNTFKPAPGSDGVIQAQQSGDDIMILSWSGSEHFKSTDSDVSLGPLGLDGIYKFVATSDSVQLGPLGLDGIALNINTTGASFGKTNSVNLKADSNFIFAGKPGTTENGLYVHKDHGVCLVSAGGKAFGLRVDESGNITTTDLSVVDPDLEVPMC